MRSTGWICLRKRLIMSKIFMAIIRFYRKYISPLKPPCCRFYPTCSEYALTAFGRFGFFKGFMLSAGRTGADF